MRLGNIVCSIAKTDLNFVLRLLEQEGITAFPPQFHVDGKENPGAGGFAFGL